MNEKYLLLERQIERDWEAVEQFLDQLAAISVDSDTEEGLLIITGYRLHHLYTTIENLFFNIARGFGARGAGPPVPPTQGTHMGVPLPRVRFCVGAAPCGRPAP